ncbi:MAG: LytTR family DNA-binding domain-containing protein [Clostridiales bacterium]|nr:LytTR family DNA-binding domain-containing protein [Clostridiales bacterium]
MNIAVIDDAASEGEYIKELILSCGRERDISVGVSVFSSAGEFFNDSDRGLDAVFTDILMPGVSGMEMAKKIRKTDGELPIVFISSDRDFALEGYEVQAFDYLVKPAESERIGKIMDRLLKLKEENIITIKQNRYDIKIPVNKVMYAEARNHNVDIFTTEGKYSTYMAFKNLLDLFSPFSGFINCRRGVIVNLDMVKGISRNYFILKDGTKIFISRNKITEAKKLYADFIFAKTRGR